MSFLFPSLLTIGLPLMAVPVLIHLINLRRQQKIRWAAMQFLLESQRQNKRWILFKQWLLLGHADGGHRGAGAAARPRGGPQRVAAAARFRARRTTSCWSTTATRSATAGKTPRRLSEAKRAVAGDCRPGPSAVRFAAGHAAAILRGGAALGRGPAGGVCAADRRHVSQQARSAARPAGNRRRPTSARPTRSRRFRGCRSRAKIRR